MKFKEYLPASDTWARAPRSALDQGRLEEGEVVVEVGGDAGVLEVGGGGAQVELHRVPGPHSLQTLVRAQALQQIKLLL